MSSRINKSAKGKRTEKELELALIKQGYLTWKPASTKYTKKDIFNIADIIALKGSPLNKLLLIQVKSHISDFYKARSMLRNFIQDNNLSMSDVVFIVALKIEKSLWRLHYFLEQEIDVRINIDEDLIESNLTNKSDHHSNKSNN